MGDSVLIVAFDGMDRELIQEYGLEHVPQQEFGQIDNHTGIKNIKTGELFASFITGETWTEHGITMVKGWNHPAMDWFERRIPTKDPFYSWAAKVKDMVKCATGLDRSPYTKDDLPMDTIFEKVPNSRAVNVPSYSVNTGIEVWTWVMDRYGTEHAAREAEKEFAMRQEEFMDALDDGHDLLMAQFHYTDFMNHMFGAPVRDDERLEAAYHRIDDFAADIIDAAEGDYDVILFMSDHGLPTENQHNRQAFYSLNREEGLDTPHITDFHDLVLDWTGAEEAVGGLDV
ncbi:MAG: alkaline phosphatase family protein [Candidatus Nanohaloarchaea archaeon]|nr:alkaline phosphatase family protein [Candidatus Nanohaloarchaea archaeon]